MIFPKSTVHPVRRLPLASGWLLGFLTFSVLTVPTKLLAQPQPVGGQFQVNTYTTFSQSEPDVAMDPAGNFVVVWESNGADGVDTSGSEILAQRFASDGSRVGQEFLVNSLTANSQRTPRVAMNASSEFLVVWEDPAVGGADPDIRARRYDSSGNPFGSEIIVTSGDDNGNPEVDLRDDGSFVVSWAIGTSNTRARRYDSSGNPLGSEIALDGSALATTPVSVAALPSGTTAFAWEGASSLPVRLYDNSGNELVTLDLASTSGDGKPEIAARGDGDFIVTWETLRSSDADGDDRSVQALRFTSGGTPQGQIFQVNSYTTGDQDNAAVVLAENGDAFVVWETESDDSEQDPAIRGTFFGSNGAPIGAELPINDVTTGNQLIPRLATDGQDRFVVTWESSSSPGNDTSTSVQARRFSVGVTGLAFLDANFNGIQDPGESGLEGITVNLHDAADGSFLDSTQTDSSGVYLFESGPGNFFLIFEAPPAYVFTGKDQGSDDSIDSDAEPSTGQTAEFSALEDGVQDAGLTNGLGDRVWLDSDADGLQDGGESGLGGVTVELFELGGSLLSSTTSDTDGRYGFADLVPGDYYVVFTAPEGFEFTGQSQGSDDAADSDADPITGATPAVVFTPGDLLLDLDAGLVEIPQIELLGGPEPSTESADFQVNTTTSGFQFSPSVARLTDGSFVVVWGSERSNGDDSDPSSVQLQRYASDGSPVGDEQQVNTLTTNSQNRPDVAAAPDGGFWITWESDVSAGDDTSSDSIQLRRFDSSGAGVGAEFQVNELTGGSQLSSAIAVADDGGVLVSWFGASDGSGSSIPARVFDSTGAAVGGQFTVNSFTTGEQYLGEVTALDSGDFLVVWSSPTASDGRQIIGRRVGTDASPVGADFQISENGASYYPTAAPHREGFVAIWEEPDNDELTGRFFDFDGQSLGSEFTLGFTADEKAIEPISEDRFAVARRLTNDGGSVGVLGQLVDFPGTPVGSAFQVNSYTPGPQEDPQLAGDPDGGQLFAVWQSDGSPEDDDEGDSVLARLMQIPAEIGDRVFSDADFDGLQDPGETGVEGAEVELYGAEGQLVGQTSTDADGRYAFYPLIADPADGELFSLRFKTPDGLALTVRDAGDDAADSDADPATGDTEPFLIRPAQVDSTRDAGLAAGLGNRVWLDADGNGIQDGGEVGVASVTVRLFDGDGTEIQQTITDADGGYAFHALPSGVYAVGVDAPAGFEFTARDQGSGPDADALDSDVNADGRSSTLLYLEGTIQADLDAGLVPEVRASVGDRVWLDANLNGIQDGGEGGFAGVVVELFTVGGVSLGTATTDLGGSYLFDDLDGGDYYVAFSEPSGFCFTAQDQGSDELDSDVNPETFTTSIFTLDSGSDDPTRDAGLVPDASIGNRVWLDDGDGIQAGGEPGVQGVTVNLYDADSQALLDNAATDAAGGYAFSPGPGDFYLEFVAPADTAFAPRAQGSDEALDSDAFSSGFTSVFTLAPGAVDTSRDAGLEPAIIGNRVWDDQNADGRQQPQEPGQRGIAVRLLDAAGAEVASTTTDAQGFYQFLGVATGTYRIEVEPPIDGVFSAQDVGSNAGDADLIDSDVDPSTGRSDLFIYEAASASQRWDAGLRILPIFADGFESGDFSAWSAVIQ